MKLSYSRSIFRHGTTLLAAALSLTALPAFADIDMQLNTSNLVSGQVSTLSVDGFESPSDSLAAVKKAFTLIELLVVIAIIAIIAAIAFPVLAKATKRARRAECASNLRQLSLAVNCYVSDWHDRYPWAYESYVAYVDQKPALPFVMKAHVPDSRLWACPNDSGEIFPKDPTGWYARTKPFCTLMSTSYEYLGLGCPYSLAGIQAGSLRHPSTTVLLCEDRPWHGVYDPTLKDRTLSPALYNTIYCDGHSEARTVRQLLSDFDWLSQ